MQLEESSFSFHSYAPSSYTCIMGDHVPHIPHIYLCHPIIMRYHTPHGSKSFYQPRGPALHMNPHHPIKSSMALLCTIMVMMSVQYKKIYGIWLILCLEEARKFLSYILSICTCYHFKNLILIQTIVVYILVE